MLQVSSEEDWDRFYTPSGIEEQQEEDEVLYQLLKRGCVGELENKDDLDQLKSMLLDQSIEDRHRAQYKARHSIFPMNEDEKDKDKSANLVQFSKYHIDFGLKEGEKCKVGAVLKDKIRVSNRGSSKVTFNFLNLPNNSNTIRLSFTPSTGTIKKNSAADIFVEMTVLCTTRVRELITVDTGAAGRHLFTIKIDSKMSQILDYKEIEIGPVIGGGGYGAIYKSRWRGLAVAVKVISEMGDGSEFEKELEMHKELLHHPNIVHFVGCCAFPKCLVLEYVEGGSLDKYLGDQHTQFSPELRLKMAYDIAKGMCFLHRNEILHLDLKPQNFLVVSLSLQAPVSIKLADFGLATSSTRSFYGATVEGSFLYMSPEVFTQKKFSRAADVWSYGACLIEILTGKRPYQEFDQLGYLELARVREEGQSPTIPSEIDPDMRKLIEACFHRDHTKRPSFENIESFLEHKCEEIIKLSQSSEPVHSGSGFFGSGAGSMFFNQLSSSPSPSSVQHQPQQPSSSSPHQFGFTAPPSATGRKLPPTPNKPIIPPRNQINKSNDMSSSPASPDTTVINKATRAMTDVGIEQPQRSELPLQRSVTISTPSSSSFIVHHQQLKNAAAAAAAAAAASSNSTPNNSTPTTNPAFITRPSTPTPPPRPRPQTPINNKSANSSNIEHPTPTTPITTTTTKSAPTSPTQPIQINTPSHIVQNNGFLNKQSSTSHLPSQFTPIHKPPVRSTSAIDIKQSTTTPTSTHTPEIQSNFNNLNIRSQSPIISEHDSNLKISELRSRSLKVLRDLYISFTETIKQFSQVKSLKECIELGQRVRDFKKDIEQLCQEHLSQNWDSIQESVKATNKRSQLGNQVGSPHPSHFDGDTYNKVIIFRDAAITVGESALDSIYYLMTLLSPNSNPTTTASSSTSSSSMSFVSGSPSTSELSGASNTKVFSQSDKEIILKIAKITRAVKAR
ncbi:protein kinase [Heterostelium album PN500]|uniref:Protein kinase n=1 Tax=Heterostelium pallidum (strain ATCC 26659 / Pp 5 / PN500) TaxID=670386 RepID=D3BQD3_HETP5|nr:protein kinase [Heterostelium album PN500]EFA76353.1 protein kinase [Heterostelium album PN500]|eukprot:XP_020428485.1 protein kinase [Heterostelium album PN500]